MTSIKSLRTLSQFFHFVAEVSDTPPPQKKYSVVLHLQKSGFGLWGVGDDLRQN